MDPVTQQSHLERSDTLPSSGQYRPAATRDSSDPRSSAPTLVVPGTSELARNIDRVQEQIERERSGDPASGRLSAGDSRHLEWCVDLGSMLKPMTTFELWIAVANGSVAPETRVWRDGMDRWRSVRSVPELVHVLPDFPRRNTAANETTGTPPPTVRECAQSEITPLKRARASAASELDLDAHASGPRTPLRTAPYRSYFFSVAVGAAVGFGAMLLALISTQGVPAGTLAALSPSAPRAIRCVSPYARALSARAQSWAASATVEPDLFGQELGQELSGTEPDGPALRPSLSARRRDPGQSRARGGSRP